MCPKCGNRAKLTYHEKASGNDLACGPYERWTRWLICTHCGVEIDPRDYDRLMSSRNRPPTGELECIREERDAYAARFRELKNFCTRELGWMLFSKEHLGLTSAWSHADILRNHLNEIDEDQFK